LRIVTVGGLTLYVLCARLVHAHRHAQQVRACITGQVGKAELLEPRTAVLDIIVVNVTGTGPQAVS